MIPAAQTTHSLPPSPGPDPVPLLETPNDCEIPCPPIINLISSPEPAPSLCVSLGSPLPPYEELIEVDAPSEDLVRDLHQMNEKARGKLRAITLDVEPVIVDSLPITPIHTSILGLPPPSPLPIPKVDMMLTGWMCVSINYPPTQFMVGGVLTQLGDVMQHLLFKEGIQGYSGPLMTATPMVDLYLHIDDATEKEK
ncbi:hypothetical protein BU17DRAFT_85049 [Hysterangium stoloniferum]|nr:hypothetical protein BU17DRAFT_85049 [Hysterangium stoloniferum]